MGSTPTYNWSLAIHRCKLVWGAVLPLQSCKVLIQRGAVCRSVTITFKAPWPCHWQICKLTATTAKCWCTELKWCLGPTDVSYTHCLYQHLNTNWLPTHLVGVSCINSIYHVLKEVGSSASVFAVFACIATHTVDYSYSGTPPYNHPVNMTTLLLRPLVLAWKKAQSDNFLFKEPL